RVPSSALRAEKEGGRSRGNASGPLGEEGPGGRKKGRSPAGTFRIVRRVLVIGMGESRGVPRLRPGSRGPGGRTVASGAVRTPSFGSGHLSLKHGACHSRQRPHSCGHNLPHTRHFKQSDSG